MARARHRCDGKAPPRYRHDPGVCCRCFSALTQCLFGYAGRSLLICENALTPSKACCLLQPAYAVIMQGRDLADLKAARALLANEESVAQDRLQPYVQPCCSPTRGEPL